MEGRTRRGVLLMGASLVLFNAYHFIAYLEGDLLKSALLLVSLLLGATCLVAGAWLLWRRPPTRP